MKHLTIGADWMQVRQSQTPANLPRRRSVDIEQLGKDARQVHSRAQFRFDLIKDYLDTMS